MIAQNEKQVQSGSKIVPGVTGYIGLDGHRHRWDEEPTLDMPGEDTLIDEEYEQWKREHGLDRPMSAEEIEQVARYELAYLEK